MHRTCHTRFISELTTNLERVAYTANAHPRVTAAAPPTATMAA